MAISPTVQAYQQQLSQGQENFTSEQLTFNKKFGDLAFQTLNAKFARLQELIVTFKVIDSDVEKGSGIGAFILRNGKDVLYLPVVLHEGTVASLEMVYAKEAETLSPLSNAEVNRIYEANRLGDANVASSNPRIENTRQLFTDMFRPPASSNPTFAGGSGVENLPAEAKDALAHHFEQNPELLSKVAGFYPVEALANKLAVSCGNRPAVSEEVVPTVLRLDDLTKEAAEALSSEDRQEMVQRGYVVKVPDTERTRTVSTAKLPIDMVTKLNLVEAQASSGLQGTGYLLHLEGNDLAFERCVVLGDLILTQKGRVGGYGDASVVLSNFVDGVSAEDLRGVGAHPVEHLPASSKKGQSSTTDGGGPAPMSQERPWSEVSVIYPGKVGYKTFREEAHTCTSGGSTRRFFLGDWYKKSIESDVFLESERGSTSLGFVKYLNNGFVKVSDGQYVFPKSALLVSQKRDTLRYISSLQALYKLLLRTSPRLKLVRDGAGLSLSDSTTAKTAHFRSEADLVEHLVTRYALSKEATDQLLRDQDLLMLTKVAFVQPSQIQSRGAISQPAGSLFSAAPQPASLVQVNNQVLDATADLGDEDLMDTGMLASLAGNEDIKALLVDMAPLFTEATTSLGRSILLFTANQEEVEGYYGREQFNTMLGKLRKIFVLLGETLDGLKSYINMH